MEAANKKNGGKMPSFLLSVGAVAFQALERIRAPRWARDLASPRSSR